MRISQVEAGSPAAKTGKLAKDQIIESVNGQVLKDIRFMSGFPKKTMETGCIPSFPASYFSRIFRLHESIIDLDNHG